MNRRTFIAGSIAATGWRASPKTQQPSGGKSRFTPCINEVTTLGAPFEQECAAYVAAGFKHVELWFPKLVGLSLTPPKVAATLRKAGLQAVSACASEGPLACGQGELASRLADLQKNFELAQVLGVPRYVVFSYVEGKVRPDDFNLAAERMVRVADLAGKYQVRVALEFIARSQLLGSLATTLEVLRRASHPNLGICLDTFHFFASISKFEDLALLRPGDIEHVHFHDVPGSIPRELLTDPDRIPSGEGIIPLKEITAALRRINYAGSLSVELFGAGFQNGEPIAVASRCFRALLPFCRATS
jgi:2-keto-myo-inositol isomerase